MQREEKKKRILRIGISIFLSICSIVILIFSSDAYLGNINTVCLWILGGIYLAIFNYFGLLGYVFSKIKKTSKKGVIIGSAIIITVILYLLLPFQYRQVLENNYLLENYLKVQTVEIEPAANPENLSAGSQICLEGIKVDGQDYNLYEITLTEGWSFLDDRPFTELSDAEPLQIQLNARESYAIMFRKGPDAGSVRITIGENSAVYDLYQKTYEQRSEIDIKSLFTGSMQNSGNMCRKILYNAVYILILLKISMALSVCAFSFMKREKKLKEENGAV